MSSAPSDLFDCARVGSYLESYLLDQVPPPERRGMRLHIHQCPACFDAVTSRDPLQLFAPLADEDVFPDGWEGFWPEIERGIASHPAPRRFPRPLRWLDPAAWTPARAAAVIAAAAAVFAFPLLMKALLTDRPPEVVSPPVVASLATDTGTPLPQTVERVLTPDSRTVQVFSMKYDQGPVRDAAAGGEAPVTELVLIVDAGLDL